MNTKMFSCSCLIFLGQADRERLLPFEHLQVQEAPLVYASILEEPGVYPSLPTD